MNRVIKFRGISTETREWVYGSLIIDGQDAWILKGVAESNNEYIAIEDWRPVKLESVGQYTGLVVYDEVEVYEADKLSFTVFDCFGSDKQYKGHVVYDGSRFMLWNKPNKEYYGFDGGFDLDWMLNQDCEAEIIGNLHQNPELIK